MEAINQERLLDALENRVELHIGEAVRVFQNMPNDALLQPAPNGGWSIVECLAHLNTYGAYYLPHLQQALHQSKAAPARASFKSTWLGRMFINMMDPDNGQKKYKAAKNHRPPAALDAPAVVGEFIRQQEELLTCLRQARKKDLDAPRIPTSIMKLVKLKPGDVLQFLVMHNERHMRQAKRNLPVLQQGSSVYALN